MRLWVVFLAILISVLPAASTPIRYVMTGDLTGSLDGTPFSDTVFTATFYSDTVRIHASAGNLFNPPLSTVISIAGFGTGSFTETVWIGLNPTAGVTGFVDPTITKGLTVQNLGLQGWSLTTAVGPVPGTIMAITGTYSTTIGSLTLGSARNMTFEATNDVPEPAISLLAGLALAGLFVLRRR